MTPPVSVVLTTYNNPRALELVLAGLTRQRGATFEVWVADDGSGPETADLVRRFARTAPFPVEHVWHEDRGFRKMRILNTVLPRVRTDYVVLLEGDCLPGPHYVGTHVRHRRRGVFLYGHRVFLGPSATTSLLADQVRSGRQPGGAWRSLARGACRRARRSYNAIRLPDPALRASQWLLRHTRPVMRGMNFSVWKDDLLAINGWNEDYQGWGREDDDLVARLRMFGLAGRSVRFGAVLFHLEHPVRRDAGLLLANDRVLQEVLRRGDPRCLHGIHDLTSRPLEEKGHAPVSPSG